MSFSWCLKGEGNVISATVTDQTSARPFPHFQLPGYVESLPNAASDPCFWRTEVEPDVVVCCLLPVCLKVHHVLHSELIFPL